MALLLGYSANASAITLPSQLIAHDEHDATTVFPTLCATFAFFLTARLLRLILFLVYAFYIPRFRSSLLVSAFGLSFRNYHDKQSDLCLSGLAFQSSFYIPLIWVKSEKAFLALTTIGMVIDMFMRYTLGLALRLGQRRSRKEGINAKPSYLLALNIE